MAVAFGPKAPSYSAVLDLDLKIRNFPVPVQWRPISQQEDENVPASPDVHMIRFLVSFAKESSTATAISISIRFDNPFSAPQST